MAIAGDTNADGQPWGDHKLFRQGHIKGEVHFDELTQVLHGDLIEGFLNLPDKLQRSIADQALNFSAYGRDIFNKEASEQLSIKELRILLTLIKH